MRIQRTNHLSDTERHQLTGWGEDIFLSEALNLLWRPKEEHLVLYVGDQPVSHCGLIRQNVQVGDFTLSIGGVGGVVTPPSYQGRGYASQIIKEALSIFTSENHAAAILFCRTALVAFYQQQGWTLLPDPVHVLQAQGSQAFPACTMVYTLNRRIWPAGTVNIDSPPW